MVNLLPAILIGGPPNAGKSVLFYSLTMVLYERGIKHHIIRACPDGEGNWFQEIHRALDPESIRLIKVKSKADWTPAFVEGMCRDLQHRRAPILVDIGGQPREWQTCILHNCTHSVLLFHDENDENARFWQQLLGSTDLLPIAQLQSIEHGSSVLTEEIPVIRGTLTGLERGTLAQGPVFEALVERIATLFSTYSLEELEQTQLQNAPAEPIVLPQLLRKFDATAKEWKPEMLHRLPDELPVNTSLAIYGKGPGWLYSALATQVGEQPFYQFDPRIGWMMPPTLQLSLQSASSEITVRLYADSNGQILSVRLNNEYLDYLQAEGLPFPPITAEQGLIINGKMPLWLLTALVRLYHETAVPWIACYQPQIQGAAVVYAPTNEHSIGDVIAMPMPL
jgi:CRISPR-associated protein Csx3